MATVLSFSMRHSGIVALLLAMSVAASGCAPLPADQPQPAVVVSSSTAMSLTAPDMNGGASLIALWDDLDGPMSLVVGDRVGAMPVWHAVPAVADPALKLGYGVWLLRGKMSQEAIEVNAAERSDSELMAGPAERPSTPGDFGVGRFKGAQLYAAVQDPRRKPWLVVEGDKALAEGRVGSPVIQTDLETGEIIALRFRLDVDDLFGGVPCRSSVYFFDFREAATLSGSGLTGTVREQVTRHGAESLDGSTARARLELRNGNSWEVVSLEVLALD